MRLVTITICLLVAFAGVTRAEEGRPFPELNQIELGGGYPEFKPRVHYQPSLATVVNKSVQEEGLDVFSIHVMDTFIDQARTTKYSVMYSEGFSADPYFILWPVEYPDKKVSISGLELYVPGNGFVYVSGHANNMFNARRKYAIRPGKVTETKQPFLYVGLETEALKELTIYSDISLRNAVATVPKNGAVEVVLNDGDYYLLKTAFGLLGWIRVDSGEEKIKGIFFNGD